ncbi:hypothetical protein U1Q18_016288 [Sarracenia purpurea var. burkii]
MFEMHEDTHVVDLYVEVDDVEGPGVNVRPPNVQFVEIGRIQGRKYTGAVGGDVELTSDNDELFDYQSDDDGGNHSSSESDLEFTRKGHRPTTIDPYKFGMEFRVDSKGKVNMAQGMLLGDVNKFR